ncbi:hypothetical protein [Sphingosinicella sp. LY1275]|nr:hypothetical protein [Sphingosinicella sp. LY1275]MEA1015901.1 hypothetical protein [Sphingosinicella sp. LY1275]
MTDDRKDGVPSKNPTELAAWERPELQRMAAGEAEVAFTSGSDGATQNS